MKKRILIVLFTALVLCLFAFSVSAANEVTLTNGTQENIETVFNVSGDTLNGFNSGWSSANIKDVVFPSNIKTIKNISFESSTDIKTVTFESNDTLVLDGVSFKASSIEKATFNPECVLNYKSGSFYNCKSMTEITFPKFQALTGNCFQFNSKMESKNNIVFVEGVTTISCHIFNGCSKVGGSIVFPSTLTEIKEGTFTGTSITSFDFSKCKNLTKFGGGYGGTFSNIDTVTSYDFSPCTSLTTFDGPAMFEGSAILESVILPANLTSIPHKTFAHCKKMQSIIIPSTVTTIADESFHSARGGETNSTFTMYIQGNVTLSSKYVFRDSGAKVEFVMVGSGITAAQFKETNAGIDIVQSGSHSPLNDIAVIDYLDPASPWTFVPGQARTSHVIVDNFCQPLALTGEHASDSNPCVINCSYCHVVKAKENPVHNELIAIAYENGYDKIGQKHIACTNEGCGYENTTDAAALFVCEGYSIPDDDRIGIAIVYKFNKAAIEEYELTNSSFKYGIFAVAETKIEANELFKADGSLTTSSVCADLSNTVTSATLKIVGFNTESQKDLKIAMGIFTTEGQAGALKHTYAQAKSPNQGDKYSFITYNDILNGQ